MGTVGQVVRATVIPSVTDSLCAHVSNTSTPVGTSALVSIYCENFSGSSKFLTLLL